MPSYHFNAWCGILSTSQQLAGVYTTGTWFDAISHEVSKSPFVNSSFMFFGVSIFACPSDCCAISHYARNPTVFITDKPNLYDLKSAMDVWRVL